MNATQTTDIARINANAMKCKYDDKVEALTSGCEWCGEGLCSFCGYIVDGEKACNECYAMLNNCDHICTSSHKWNGCNCDCGEYHKDMPYAKVGKVGPRSFSPEQERIIARHERICELAKCENYAPDGHGDHLTAEDLLIDLEKNEN